MKEADNPYDSEAIKAVLKHVGTVGYVANTPYTSATGTMTAGRIWDKVGKKFHVRVMFITASKVICRVIDEDESVKKKELRKKLDVAVPSTLVGVVVGKIKQ